MCKLVNEILPIEGEKIKIRPIIESDLKVWLILEKDQETQKYLRNKKLNYSDKKWLDKAQSKIKQINCSILAIADKKNDQFMGRASLVLSLVGSQIEYEVMVILSSDSVNKKSGLGREACQLLVEAAFKCLSAKSVIAKTHPENERCIKMLNKLNFSFFEKEIQGIYKDWLIYKRETRS